MAQDVAPTTPTGFLTDYTRLTPALSPRSDFQSYTAQDAAGRPLGRVYIKPLASYPENASFEYIDRATLAAFESKFDGELNTHVNEKVILVTTPEQADTIIELAVTGVTAVEPNRKLVDFMPLRLITKPIKDATMGKQQEVLMTLEMKMINVKTREVAYESLTRAKGKTMGRTKDEDLHTDIKELEPVIDDWTSKISKEIGKLQAGR
jgi:hypothetical protein